MDSTGRTGGRGLGEVGDGWLPAEGFRLTCRNGYIDSLYRFLVGKQMCAVSQTILLTQTSHYRRLQVSRGAQSQPNDISYTDSQIRLLITRPVRRVNQTEFFYVVRQTRSPTETEAQSQSNDIALTDTQLRLLMARLRCTVNQTEMLFVIQTVAYN